MLMQPYVAIGFNTEDELVVTTVKADAGRLLEVPLDAVRFDDDGIQGSASKRALHGVASAAANTCAPAPTAAANALRRSTLNGTAKLNGIDPEAWFHHVLATIALTSSCPGVASDSWLALETHRFPAV